MESFKSPVQSFLDAGDLLLLGSNAVSEAAGRRCGWEEKPQSDRC